MSETTAMSDTTAMSAKTAMSTNTAISEPEPEPAAIADHPLSYAALMDSAAFVLDCWQVYPTRNLIRFRSESGDGGKPAEQRQLEPRLMRLLCLLAASAESVVNRDDIISVLWPRVVVNENSLTRAVSDLRRLLTPAGAARTALIQTIPKRGYRLTTAPTDIEPQTRPLPSNWQTGVDCKPTRTALTERWVKRWTPSIAACFILVLALVLRVSDQEQSKLPVAQLATDAPLIAGEDETSHPIYDRVIGAGGLTDTEMLQDARALTTHLPEASEAPFHITRLGSAPTASLQSLQESSNKALRAGQSMLTPDGQLLAYVDKRDGISSLNLRPALTDAEPWVAFTTDEQILHLQWSPLDAGILLTVGQAPENQDQVAYLRLMLLDLETLTLQELYRRELPGEHEWPRAIGNLT